MASGLSEAFGVWLNLTEAELLRGGFNVTSDENKMNVIINSGEVIAEPMVTSYWWVVYTGIGIIVVSTITFFVIKKLKSRKQLTITE